MEDVILALALKYNGGFDNILTAIQLGETVTEEQKKSAIKSVKEKGYKYTTLVSEDYPSIFKDMTSPPFAVFYKGNLGLLDATIGHNTLVNVTGTKTYDDYGKKVTKQVVKVLCKKEKCIIITGNNFGVESIIVDTVLEKGSKIIIVYNGGTEENEEKSLAEILKLLKENNYSKNDYLIVTEYPNTVYAEIETVKKYRRYNTERLAISMSDKLLITASTDENLQSYLTANVMGKDIFVVPAPYDNQVLTNNHLLNGGVKALAMVDNLFEDYD